MQETILRAYRQSTNEEEKVQEKPSSETSPLPLVYYPDPRLKMACEPITEVTDEIRQLAKDMILTMMLEGGVGLAGPQVGKLLQIFVVDVKWPQDLDQAEPHIFINPEVIAIEEAKSNGFEGCLSFPGGRAKVERYSSVTVKYLDLEGTSCVLDASGFFARVIQHENDHLKGSTIQGALSGYDMTLVRKNIVEKVRGRKREVKSQGHQKNVRKRSR